MCTGITFTDKKGQVYFGRNLDLDDNNYGEHPLIVPRGYKMQYRHMPTKEISKAIIGMGMNVGNYPLLFEAGNEEGMCIANLNFPKHAYFAEEVQTDKKYNVTPYEFMIWVLDSFSSVKELKEALKDTYLVGTPFAPSMPIAPVHWLISDGKDTIVVEQTKELGLVAYDNGVDVLTNSPDFWWHLQNLNNYLGLSSQDATNTTWNRQKLQFQGIGTGQLGLRGDSSTQSRFVKAAFLNANYPTQDGENANVAKLFNILWNVAMPYGSVVNENGAVEYTIYSSCYSQATKTYYYRRAKESTIHSCSLTEENSVGTDIVDLK